MHVRSAHYSLLIISMPVDRRFENYLKLLHSELTVRHSVIVIAELSADDTVHLLNTIVEDVLPPTVTPEWLRAVLRSHMRRLEEDRIQLRVGGILVDKTTRLCTVNGEPVKLTKASFKLLVFLMERKGVVMSISEILEHVWKGKQVNPEILAVYIRKLRLLLEVNLFVGLGI